MSKMATRGDPGLSRVTISSSGVELGKAMSSIQPRLHKGAKGNRFGGNVGENIKGMSWNSIGEVRDYSNAVPGIRGIVGRCVSRWGSVRKSRGRFRM